MDKDLRNRLLGGAALLGAGLLSVNPASAQSNVGTVTTQSAARPDAAIFVTQNSRTSCTTSQDTVANLTLTLTPSAGNYVYLSGFYVQVANNSTGANSQVAWTTTNLTGSPVWLTGEQASALAGVQQVGEIYPTGLKATAPGTAVTITPSATMASAFQCAKAVWWQAPQ